MTKVSNWNKFDKAFEQVQAYVVLDQNTMQPIAKVALKFPKDGAGRLNCFIHVIGMEVQHGYVGGYGYDKRTASIISAARKCQNFLNDAENYQNVNGKQKQFIDLLLSDDAQGGWKEVINHNNGFIVIQVI